MEKNENVKKALPFISGFLLGGAFCIIFLSFIWRSNPWLFGAVSLLFCTFTGWMWWKKGASKTFKIFAISILIITGMIMLVIGTCAFSFQGFY